MQLRKIRVMLCGEKMFSPLCFVQITCPNIFSLIYWCISKLLHTQYLTFLSKNWDISHLCSCTLPYSHHVTCKCSITSSQKKLTFPVVHCFLFAFKKKKKINLALFQSFCTFDWNSLCSQTGVKVRECCVACQSDFWKIFSTKSGVMNAGWIGGQTFGSVVHYANRDLRLSH